MKKIQKGDRVLITAGVKVLKEIGIFCDNVAGREFQVHDVEEYNDKTLVHIGGENRILWVYPGHCKKLN